MRYLRGDEKRSDTTKRQTKHGSSYMVKADLVPGVSSLRVFDLSDRRVGGWHPAMSPSSVIYTVLRHLPAPTPPPPPHPSPPPPAHRPLLDIKNGLPPIGVNSAATCCQGLTTHNSFPFSTCSQRLGVVVVVAVVVVGVGAWL